MWLSQRREHLIEAKSRYLCLLTDSLPMSLDTLYTEHDEKDSCPQSAKGIQSLKSKKFTKEGKSEPFRI